MEPLLIYCIAALGHCHSFWHGVSTDHTQQKYGKTYPVDILDKKNKKIQILNFSECNIRKLQSCLENQSNKKKVIKAIMHSLVNLRVNFHLSSLLFPSQAKMSQEMQNTGNRDN